MRWYASWNPNGAEAPLSTSLSCDRQTGYSVAREEEESLSDSINAGHAASESRSQETMANSKLHLVFGGRVKDPQGLEFVDLANLDVVGIFPDFQSAEKAWRSSSQRTVDDAEMRYVVVHLHRLLDPEKVPSTD